MAHQKLNIQPGSEAQIGDVPVYDGTGWLPQSVSAVTTLTPDIDGRYRQVQRALARPAAAQITGAGVYTIQTNGNAAAQSAAGAPPNAITIDTTAFAITGRSTKLRLVSAAGVADNAPGIDLTLGLYPIGTPSGGTTVWNPNFATVVTGSTVAFLNAALTANSASADVSSGDFTCPATGWYAVALAASGAMVANATVLFPYRLEVRNV